MLSVSRRLSHPMLARSARLLAMAGPSESVLMVKVRSPHLFPFAQENSRSNEGLTVSMCGRKVVRRYATGGRAQLDVEDIDFDIYKKARELMESSGIILAHEHVRRDEFYLSTYLLLSIYMSMHLIYVLDLPQFKVFI